MPNQLPLSDGSTLSLTGSGNALDPMNQILVLAFSLKRPKLFELIDRAHTATTYPSARHLAGHVS
jgi:hypothetical protein